MSSVSSQNIDTTPTPLDRSSKARRVHDVLWQRVATMAAAERRPAADQLDLLVDEALRARGLPALHETPTTAATG